MELEQFLNLWTFLVKSKNFTDFWEFNFCQICMVRVYWNSWRNFLRKVCTIFKPFRHLTEILLIFSQKNIGSVVKTELYDSSATFSRKSLLKNYKCFSFFWISKINCTSSRGYSTGCQNNILRDQRNILTKTFRKNLIFTELFPSVSKKLWSFW